MARQRSKQKTVRNSAGGRRVHRGHAVDQPPADRSAEDHELSASPLSPERRLAELEEQITITRTKLEAARAEIDAKTKIAETLKTALECLRKQTEAGLNHFQPLITTAFTEAVRLVEREKSHPAYEVSPGLDARDYFLLRLGEIVERYRNRYANSARYFEQVREGVQFARLAAEKVAAAADQMDRLNEVIGSLDISHRRGLRHRLNEFSLGGINLDDIKHVPSTLRQCQDTIMVLGILLAPCAESSPRGVTKPGFGTVSTRGKPSLPYFDAALDLVELWEEMTGLRVTYPQPYGKGKDRDIEAKAAEHSTEFIQLTLRMIDPKVTTSQVMTYLKNVYTNRVNSRREMERYPGVSGFASYVVHRALEARLISPAIASELLRRIEAAQAGPFLGDPSDLNRAAEVANEIISALKPKCPQ